jgi:hypothetical protein
LDWKHSSGSGAGGRPSAPLSVRSVRREIRQGQRWRRPSAAIVGFKLHFSKLAESQIVGLRLIVAVLTAFIWRIYPAVSGPEFFKYPQFSGGQVWQLLGATIMNVATYLTAQIPRTSLLAALTLTLSSTAIMAEPISERQAHVIGVEAYLYLYFAGHNGPDPQANDDVDLRDRLAEEFKLPKETQRIEAPTPYVCADFGRIEKFQKTSWTPGSGRGDLIGDHLEACECARAEWGHDRGVGGVAPTCHQDAADTRLVVASIKHVPAAAKIGYRLSAATVLCAFDLIELDGEDLRRTPIETRKSTLKSLLRARNKRRP